MTAYTLKPCCDGLKAPPYPSQPLIDVMLLSGQVMLLTLRLCPRAHHLRRLPLAAVPLPLMQQAIQIMSLKRKSLGCEMVSL